MATLADVVATSPDAGHANGQPVTVASKSFAREYWPGENVVAGNEGCFRCTYGTECRLVQLSPMSTQDRGCNDCKTGVSFGEKKGSQCVNRTLRIGSRLYDDEVDYIKEREVFY
jgi:hypothetical protein